MYLILKYVFVQQLSELDFRDSILTVGFNEDQSNILQELYNSQLSELSRVMVEQTVDFPQFKNMEWRLEAQVREMFCTFIPFNHSKLGVLIKIYLPVF